MSEKEHKTCVRCFYRADEKDKHCIKCGAPLTNYCSDTKRRGKHHCGHINKSDAAYCAKCGSETIFKRQGLI